MLAWNKFQRGKIKKIDVCAFEVHLEDNLFALRESLSAGTYCHGPYEHFFVNDPKRRYISKAAIRDRIVHQAVVQIIEPLFEKRFIFDSYLGILSHGSNYKMQKCLREKVQRNLSSRTQNFKI